MNRVKDHVLIEYVLLRVANLYEIDWRMLVNRYSYRGRPTHRAQLTAIYILSFFIERDSISEAFRQAESTVRQYTSNGKKLFATSLTFKSIVSKIKTDIVKNYY